MEWKIITTRQFWNLKKSVAAFLAVSCWQLFRLACFISFILYNSCLSSRQTVDLCISGSDFSGMKRDCLYEWVLESFTQFKNTDSLRCFVYRCAKVLYRILWNYFHWWNSNMEQYCVFNRSYSILAFYLLNCCINQCLTCNRITIFFV